MKKSTFLAALAALLAVAGIVYAGRTDKFQSRNAAGAEFRITEDEVIVQTGTSGSTNALGPTAVTGAFSASGALSSTAGRLSGVGLTNSGTRIATAASVTIGAGTTTTPTSEFALFTSTGGAITSTATPFLATTTATNGQFYEIMSSTTSDIVLGDDGSVSGSLLELASGQTSRTLSNPGDVIGLRYYNGKWYEIYFVAH